MGVTVTGIEEALSEHRVLAARARDLTPVLRRFAAELEEMIARAFRERRSPGGDRWAATSRESESSGELERSVSVRVQGDELVINVGAEHASFVFFGTRHAPGRNPLPVEWVGGQMRWMDRGGAKAWMESMQERLHTYLTASEAA